MICRFFVLIINMLLLQLVSILGQFEEGSCTVSYNTTQQCKILEDFDGLHLRYIYFFYQQRRYSINAVCPSVCMYVCMYVCLSGLGGNTIFRPLIEISLQLFFVQIPLINELLFCKYFVRWSVRQATNGRNVKIQKKIFSRLLFKIDV